MTHIRLTYFVLLLSLMAHTEASAQFDKLKASVQQATNKVNQATQSKPSAPAGTPKTPTPAAPSATVAAADVTHYYIRPDGKGKEATQAAPARDIAVVAMLVKAGDVIHVAAGTYTSKVDQSSDVFTVPVSIIGGYSPDFSTRDPWGQYRTVFSGSNDITKALTTERIGILTDKDYRDWTGEIVVDGIIIDNGARNHYADATTELLIRRKASAETGMNPTPNTPGIKIRTGAGTRVVVRNCIITNVGATQGALDVQVGKNGAAHIENNLIVNNTGEGIMCKSNHHGTTGQPTYTVRNNTILFNWKHDAIASFGGNSVMFDNALSISLENNVFGFGDYGGVNNVKQCPSVTLRGNLFVGHRKYDYQEFSTGMSLAETEDYANYLTRESGSNYSQEIQLRLPTAWAETYFNRQEISRAEVDAAAKVSNSGANQLRAMFGLPLQANSVGKDASVWLHRLPLDAAIALGTAHYGNRTGCTKPAAAVNF